jgi:hypothetical protein
VARAEPSRAAAELVSKPAPARGDWESGLSWLGWTLAALGVLTAWSTADTPWEWLGRGAAVVGAVCVVVGVTRAARKTSSGARVWPLSSAGAILLAGGAAILVYPCFITLEELRSLHEEASYLPLVAFATCVAGVALLIAALHRIGTSEPPFSATEEAKYRAWWPRIRLILPPFGLYYLPIYLWESWREIDREAARDREARAAAGETGYDWRPLVVFSFGAVCLALMEYFGHGPTLRDIIDHFDPPDRFAAHESFFAIVRRSPFHDLTDFVWWSGWGVLGFFVMPAIVVKLVLRERLSDYGLSPAGFLKHAWIYALFFCVVLVAVVVVSHEESFRTYYPFYRNASRSWYDFWAWELLYAAQFFSLEFFFRGFWLKAAKQAMGSHAIYAMVVPYCMIHFGKPFPETLAAILAGIVLGTLALRTRSIWSGFLIHVSVALSMDIAALLQTSGLPERFWPVL